MQMVSGMVQGVYMLNASFCGEGCLKQNQGMKRREERTKPHLRIPNLSRDPCSSNVNRRSLKRIERARRAQRFEDGRYFLVQTVSATAQGTCVRMRVFVMKAARVRTRGTRKTRGTSEASPSYLDSSKGSSIRQRRIEEPIVN